MGIDFKPAFIAKLNVEDLFKVVQDEAHRQYGVEAQVNISFSGALQDSSLAATVTVMAPPAVAAVVSERAPPSGPSSHGEKDEDRVEHLT